MKYRADYLADERYPSDRGGSTLLIYADSDAAAHQLALMHVPPDMALHSVYRVEVRDYERRELRKRISKLPEYGFGELHDTITLLLSALDEADSEKAAHRAALEKISKLTYNVECNEHVRLAKEALGEQP